MKSEHNLWVEKDSWNSQSSHPSLIARTSETRDLPLLLPVGVIGEFEAVADDVDVEAVCLCHFESRYWPFLVKSATSIWTSLSSRWEYWTLSPTVIFPCSKLSCEFSGYRPRKTWGLDEHCLAHDGRRLVILQLRPILKWTYPGVSGSNQEG